MFLDFVNLITTMPSRHSGESYSKVDIFPVYNKGVVTRSAYRLRSSLKHPGKGLLMDAANRTSPRSVAVAVFAMPPTHSRHPSPRRRRTAAAAAPVLAAEALAMAPRAVRHPS